MESIENIPPDRLRKAENLLYEYQRRRLEATYSDIDGIEDVRELFFKLVYPPPGERHRFEERNRAFVRNTRSRLIRLICSRPVIKILENTVVLKDMTDRINDAIASELCGMDPMPDSVDDSLVFELNRRVSSYRERMRQLDYVMDDYWLGAGVVLHFPFNLRQIIRLIPRSLIKNGELLELAVRTYEVFESHREQLKEYQEVIREREAAHIRKMFDTDESEAV